jgi:cytochrome bd-type quinol oxidase subunit 2
MKHRFARIAAVLALAVSLLAGQGVLATPAFAQSNSISGPLKCGVELRFGTNCALQNGNVDSTANNILRQIVNIFSVIVGIVAVFMIIVGGLRYITSGGDSSKVNSAKNTILYAIIGLVVVALAQVIVGFVVQRLGQAVSGGGGGGGGGI